MAYAIIITTRKRTRERTKVCIRKHLFMHKNETHVEIIDVYFDFSPFLFLFLFLFFILV